MARQPRLCPPGMPQHVIQRGNNRISCFVDDQDRAVFANWLNLYSKRFAVAIHAWVFMTNHVHLLMTPAGTNGVSATMQALGRRYVRYFNRRHGRTGTLWEGRFRSCLVESETYLLRCYRYIELNPVRAGMVTTPSQYAWSSYACNALGNVSELCTPHPEYLQLHCEPEQRLAAYRELFGAPLDDRVLNEIREAVNKCLVLGSDDFKQRLERETGQRTRPAARGRPRKSDLTPISGVSQAVSSASVQ